MVAEGNGVLFKADAIAETFRAEIKAELSSAPRVPKLVGILATNAAPSKFYSEFTRKQCDALGVEFVLKKTGQAADESLAPGEGVEEAIIEANEDESIDGIMVCSQWGAQVLCDGLLRPLYWQVYYPIFGVQQVRRYWHIRSQINIVLNALRPPRTIICNKLSWLVAVGSDCRLTHAQIVSPFKDVEGLHFKFHYNLYHK